MCQTCVDIVRQRITVREALDHIKEGFMAGAKLDEHKADILDSQNDLEKLKQVIIDGYKKERWL